MIEVRWHARAGQGAKTASQLLATAALREGAAVQAFPEYGPERRGAPMRAYTRLNSKPIRRHDPVTEPSVVVVLEPSLLDDPAVLDGLRPAGLVLVNAAGPGPPPPRNGTRVLCVPADELAAESGGFVNVVMTGALAAALGEPPLDCLLGAAPEVLGPKAGEATLAAIRMGYAAVSARRNGNG